MAEDTERKEYGAKKENRECQRQDPIPAKKKVRLKHKCPEGRKETQLFQPTRTNR